MKRKHIKVTVRVFREDVITENGSIEKYIRKEVKKIFKKYLERTEEVKNYLKDIPLDLPRVSNYDSYITFTPEKEAVLSAFGEDGANTVRRIYFKAYNDVIDKIKNKEK